LEWLKTNNHNYKNIKINQFDQELSDTELDRSMDSLVVNEKFIIEPISSSSIYELDKISDRNDIEKYQLLHIDKEPFTDNFPNIDHYCFPNIFCYGKGLK
jgi:hypothetical protein